MKHHVYIPSHCVSGREGRLWKTPHRHLLTNGLDPTDSAYEEGSDNTSNRIQ